MCRRKADASIRTRNTSGQYRRRFFSFAVALSSVSTRLSSVALVGRRWAFIPRDVRDPDAVAREAIHSVEPEDLLSFGLIPEFIGRLPVVSTLDALSEDELLYDSDRSEERHGEAICQTDGDGRCRA